MILFNAVLILAAIFVASLLLGSIFSADKSEGFGATLRRGLTILVLLAVLMVALLAINENPTTLYRIADYIQKMLNF